MAIGGAIQPGVPEGNPEQVAGKGDNDSNDRELLGLALEHCWKWYEMRSSHTLQVINFYLVSVAVLSAGYVSALSSHMNHVAGMVGLLAASVTTAAFFAGRRYDQKGHIAKEPLIALQSRLAAALDVATLKMVERDEQARRPWSGLRHVARIVYVFALGACLAAAAYGFFSR
ncbi:hypothetical protein WEI85_04700 [Actinomycetes bacterium KLBMP 9797]